MPSPWGTDHKASLSRLNGVFSFQFSPMFISALNTAKVSLGEEEPAVVLAVGGLLAACFARRRRAGQPSA